MTIAGSIHIAVNGILPFFSWLSNIPLSIHTTSSSFLCWWTLRFLSCLGYCAYCCREHWMACIFSNLFSPATCPAVAVSRHRFWKNSEILGSGERVLIHFQKEERGQACRVVLAPKGEGFSLLLSFKGQAAAKGGGFTSFLVHGSVQTGCVSIGGVFLENRLPIFSDFPVLRCLKETW